MLSCSPKKKSALSPFSDPLSHANSFHTVLYHFYMEGHCPSNKIEQCFTSVDFVWEKKHKKIQIKLKKRSSSHIWYTSTLLELCVHLTLRDQACNLKLWMVLMSGRGLTESNKRCHWINKLHVPWKHRQPVSDNIGMAAHKSLLQTMSSNTAWRLSSLKTHVFMGISL